MYQWYVKHVPLLQRKSARRAALRSCPSRGRAVEPDGRRLERGEHPMCARKQIRDCLGPVDRNSSGPPSRHMLACPKGDLTHRGLDFPAAGAISACGISKTWWSTNTARSMGECFQHGQHRDRDALRELDILGEHRGS